MSYPAALALHASTHPDSVAMVCDDEAVTWSELDRRSTQLAHAFEKRGVAEGSFVTIALPNGVAFVESCFAAWKLGASPQPISSRLPDREHTAIIEHAKPSLVVGVSEANAAGFPSIPVGFDASGESDVPHPDRVAPARQALASGGSTGTPKLIIDVLKAECDPTEPFYGNQPGTTVLVPGPMYHAAGFVNTTTTLLLRGQLILMSRFDAEQALALIERHGVQWISFVPTMLQRIWRLPEEVRGRYDLSSLTRVVSSGAPCPPWLMEALIGWLGADIMCEAYGGTERIGGTMITGTEWLAHPGSVGKPTMGRKIRIQGPGGEELPAGEVGEVFMMPPGGRGSTYRYVGAESRSSSDGWESLGDLGYVDADGYLYLTDRRTDMIVTGGENVYPAEVEAALLSHAGVLSCAVIGLPDEDFGQRIHAIVQAEDLDEDTLKNLLREQLDRYKVPRSFEFVSEPLRDEAGKVRRSALREARLPES
jgi:bile acid-coenzyme A ligase